MNEIVIADKAIRFSDGLYCLNDLHKASGGEKRYEPYRWLRLVQTSELIRELEFEQREPQVWGSMKNQPLIKTIKGFGKQQGTFACRELVYSYAMWISPKFHLQVVRAFDALVTGRAVVPAACPNRIPPSAIPFELSVPRSAAEARKLASQLALERRSLDLKIARAQPWLRFWADLEAEDGSTSLPLC
ncbi:KilA-N domain-containing protein [Neisseria weixii]|uniref:KilA-N domain-containing protein n=1 Tax=Neisseria weixii TaxID=1853276 RepID=A0A3N4N334_9NEIS|nr:KilA-N domain-containing protein [Neisseria weixii]RPD90501.1 KilA-N domain-containing protein [Neisseria weixii]RPD90557.1 KilA-N domain-containing protein [Neisseria weixii]